MMTAFVKMLWLWDKEHENVFSKAQICITVRNVLNLLKYGMDCVHLFIY